MGRKPRAGIVVGENCFNRVPSASSGDRAELTQAHSVPKSPPFEAEPVGVWFNGEECAAECAASELSTDD